MSSTVLIVDDSLTVRMHLKHAFEVAGLHVDLAADLGQARARLQGGDIGIVILDLKLPDGDGLELVGEMRRDPARAAIAVLVLSSEAEVKDRVRALQIGADEYVGKPYDVSYVIARTRELMRARKAGPRAERATVLVVDDSSSYREGLRGAFEEAGYDVLTASSGEEGLRVAADRRPSVLVVDSHMKGIDGATVIRRIRLDAALRVLPCVMLTGSDDGGVELRALDAGADAFVRKEEDIDVILARVAAVLRRAAAPREDGVSVAGPRKILLVDDSPDDLTRLGGELRGEGYEVILARSGEEALELLAVQAVDCVLLDVTMPGLGGVATCARIKGATAVREVPLILLAAGDDRATMIEGLAAGADDVLVKASEIEVVKARVRAQLRRKQYEDEHRRIREQLLRSELEAAEARGAGLVAEARAALADELARKNEELEAFSYSVSHDLRTPLHSIGGFAQALSEDCGDRLDEEGRHYLDRILLATQRMNELIDDLLQLSMVGRSDLQRSIVSISELATAILDDLQRKQPERVTRIAVEPGLVADADGKLVRVVLENLLGNAWKFTGKTERTEIGVGRIVHPRGDAYYVSDNGAGFDMARASNKLFVPFQRLHRSAEFPGTGIGLATVRRVIDRHGGEVWAESAIGKGTTIYFTLPLLELSRNLSRAIRP